MRRGEGSVQCDIKYLIPNNTLDKCSVLGNIKIYPSLYPSLDRFIRHLTISARMWISLIILIQFDHQNDYDQSSSSVRVVISMIEHPTYACNMSQRWLVLVGTQVFVIADIWICWFGRFVFVKPSLSHLQTSDKHINTCFGAVMDFSQNMFCIFRVLLSTFTDIC